MIKKIYYLLYFLFICNAYAQHPVYIQFSEKDDLPDIEFYNITEDSKGFIWLAANKGLYRYDGNKFKIYTNNEKRGLSVFEPKEDIKGRVWCCNITGQFFYVKDDELITFIDLGKEIGWKLGSFFVTEKHLLVFAYNTVYKISLKTKEIEARIKLSETILGSPYRDKNEIYVTTDTSIITLDLELNVTKKMTSEAIAADLSNHTIGKTKIDGYKEKTYLTFMDESKNSHLYQFNVNTGVYKKIKLKEELTKSHIVTLSFYNDEILFSSSTGLWIYTMKDGEIFYKNRYFKDQYISKLIVDKSENYWITTLRKGVFVIPNIHNKSYDFPNNIEDFECIEKIDDASFFFGTADGDAGFYNIKTNAVELIDLKNTTAVTSALYNKNKNVLYISQKGQSVSYDLKTKKITYNNQFNNSRSLSYIDKNSFLFTNYRRAVKVTDGKNNYLLGNLRAYTGFYDTISKNSYVSFVDDLMKYDSVFNKKKIRYKGKQINAIAITKTANGLIWVSTSKNGLYTIQNDSVVMHYNTENGLVSNLTHKIKGVGNDLWIVTNKGIQLLNTETKTFKTLTKKDGISTYLISGIIPFENNVVFSTNTGVFSIDRKAVFKKNAKPEIYFTGIQINEKDTLIQEKFTLSHEQNAIKFSFNSNGFHSKQNIKYQSRLLGFNDNWIPVSEGIDFIKYNSLPVGNFTFQVKATSNSSDDESDIAAIKIAIKSPFWQKSWFIIGSVLSVLLLIILYYKNILKKRELQKNKELEKLAQERELVFLKLENLRSQMNPHFIFNALNSIQEYIILNKKNLASDYLGKFADLIRMYLNHSNKGTISVQDEVECIEMYLELEELRFEDKLNYSVHIRNIDIESFMIPTMLIQPYVENALKHGLLHKKDNRMLYIELKALDDKNAILCTIEDNGIGRAKALELKARKDKMHKSFGTQATKDRLDLLNYGKAKQIGVTIEDLYEPDQQTPRGTKVVITIPVTKTTTNL